MCFGTHDKARIDPLQDLFLNEDHGLSFPLFYPLLLQFLAGVHFTRGPHLAGAHLAKASFTQNAIHSESFIRHRLAVEREEIVYRDRENWTTQSIIPL